MKTPSYTNLGRAVEALREFNIALDVTEFIVDKTDLFDAHSDSPGYLLYDSQHEPGHSNMHHVSLSLVADAKKEREYFVITKDTGVKKETAVRETVGAALTLLEAFYFELSSISRFYSFLKEMFIIVKEEDGVYSVFSGEEIDGDKEAKSDTMEMIYSLIPDALRQAAQDVCCSSDSIHLWQIKNVLKSPSLEVLVKNGEAKWTFFMLEENEDGTVTTFEVPALNCALMNGLLDEAINREDICTGDCSSCGECDCYEEYNANSEQENCTNYPESCEYCNEETCSCDKKYCDDEYESLFPEIVEYEGRVALSFTKNGEQYVLPAEQVQKLCRFYQASLFADELETGIAHLTLPLNFYRQKDLMAVVRDTYIDMRFHTVPMEIALRAVSSVVLDKLKYPMRGNFASIIAGQDIIPPMEDFTICSKDELFTLTFEEITELVFAAEGICIE